MAVYFRHGSNGSYKSAYAVWFEVVPALREGRLVVTNIEGLKPLKEIESLLGEKFPPTAQLIRIFTRSEEGVMLWQNWFCWMPIGALVVIDECQDLFSPDVGFKREKALYRPLSEFINYLPDDFNDVFNSRWLPTPPEQIKEGDVDDTGRTEYDEYGRIIYPYNFYGAFMRHRKYQWDIIMLTPDWTSIPTWLRGCAQEAYSHRSTDTFFRKRKPRIFNHSPKSTKTDPSTKKDELYVTSKQIPIDVFALYKSTATGAFNESKSDISIFKSPRFILVTLLMFASAGYFLWGIYDLLFNSSLDENQTVLSETSQPPVVQTSSVSSNDDRLSGSSSPKANSQGAGSVAHSRGSVQSDIKNHSVDVLNPFHEYFPMFNDLTSIYLTAINTIIFSDGHVYNEFLFRIDKTDSTYYLNSSVLQSFGYEFIRLDDCFVYVISEKVNHLLTCPPYESYRDSSYADARAKDVDNLAQSVSIFSL